MAEDAAHLTRSSKRLCRTRAWNADAFSLLCSGWLVVARNGDCFPKSEQGIFEHLHQALANDADLEHLLIDSTINRAHPCAAGAPKKVAVKPRKP